MGKSAIVTAVVAVLVLVGGGIWLASRNNNSTNNTETTTSNSTNSSMENMNMSNQSQSSNSTPGATSSVTIENFAFSPANITVKKGTTVTWTNRDSTTHTVTETDGKDGPKSGNLANGKSYQFTFNTVGTFKYACSIHPDMVGTVTVTE